MLSTQKMIQSKPYKLDMNSSQRQNATKKCKNMYCLVKRCQALDEESKRIVRPVLQHNGYFAHSECLLLSMLVDHSKSLRMLAFRRIMKARKSENSCAKRRYSVPEINFDAHSYADMISWDTENINDDDSDEDPKFVTSYTEPPVLSDLSEENLKEIAEKGEISDNLYYLPCHNQKVERAIKLVSQSSQKAREKIDREGIIQTVIASRAALPSFETKKDFKVKWNLPNKKLREKK